MRRDLEFTERIASTASNTTINQFQKYRAEESLVLRPPFQRNLVWNREQQSFLIDSVLRGLPVPEVYVQINTSASGEERVVVVDGQQRISACLQFLSGDLRLDDGEDLDVRWRNRVFNELDEELQRRFRSYELIVRKMPNLEESVLREIFRRLNKTVEPLLPQELRHAAYTGPFIKFVEAAGAAPVLGEVGVFTARDYLRRRSDELMAEIAFALVSHAYPNKKEGLDELFLTYERQGVPPGVLDDLAGRFGRTFTQLTPLAGALRRTRFRNKSDFYTLFTVLAKNAELLPLAETASKKLEFRLREFSSLINGIKQDETDRRSIDDLESDENSPAALQYLRAVERAASDRLNRVRRDEALQRVLAPVLAHGEINLLNAADAQWQNDPSFESPDEEDDDGERVHAREVLADIGGGTAD